MKIWLKKKKVTVKKLMKFVTFGRDKNCGNAKIRGILADTYIIVFGYLNNRIKGRGHLVDGGLLIAVSTVDPDQVL